MQNARANRNEALVNAHASGALLREMAEATGLSIEGVRRAIAQHER